MKRQQTPWLTINDNIALAPKRSGGYSLCMYALHKLWKIPCNAKMIRLFVAKHPSKWSHTMRFSRSDTYFNPSTNKYVKDDILIDGYVAIDTYIKEGMLRGFIVPLLVDRAIIRAKLDGKTVNMCCEWK